MVAVSLIFGGDWIRQGEFAVGSKPWSPRHVKQGQRQIELTTLLLLSLVWLSLLNLVQRV